MTPRTTVRASTAGTKEPCRLRSAAGATGKGKNAAIYSIRRSGAAVQDQCSTRPHCRPRQHRRELENHGLTNDSGQPPAGIRRPLLPSADSATTLHFDHTRNRQGNCCAPKHNTTRRQGASQIRTSLRSRLAARGGHGSGSRNPRLGLAAEGGGASLEFGTRWVVCLGPVPTIGITAVVADKPPIKARGAKFGGSK
jgi:hypothetical protein